MTAAEQLACNCDSATICTEHRQMPDLGYRTIFDAPDPEPLAVTVAAVAEPDAIARMLDIISDTIEAKATQGGVR